MEPWPKTGFGALLSLKSKTNLVMTNLIFFCQSLGEGGGGGLGPSGPSLAMPVCSTDRVISQAVNDVLGYFILVIEKVYG